jgi:presenilin-like A22 family membrane protease
MSEVASHVNLPMKLLWPTSLSIPIKNCSMLGLGDIILPGLLLSYCARFDTHKHTNNTYYKTFLYAYTLALITCFLVLGLTAHPQPALLYIVPYCLTMVGCKAITRQEIIQMWRGIANT